MHYFAILILNGTLATAGPFQGNMACEAAIYRAKLLSVHVTGVCVPVRAQGTHWNGKAVPK